MSGGAGTEDPVWTISIVSHGHGVRVCGALSDIHAQLAATPHRFVVTLNAGEDPACLDSLPDGVRARLAVLRNEGPRGFAANHNAALLGRRSRFVLVADPDLRLPEPVFAALEAELQATDCGIVAPLAQTSGGVPEDNARSLTTPTAILRRALLGRQGDVPAQPVGRRNVDWVAGLFMAMRADTFARLDGFDERYFMYCEDVDLCLRARHMGLTVRQLGDLRITHDANRNTLKQLRHFAWHSQSLLRLWRSPAYRAALARNL